MAGQGIAESVQVSLTPIEQALFVAFRKYQDNLNRIIRSGALDITNGSFTCHLDGAGEIKAIDKHERLVV
jgi:hypothetical protein